MKLRFILTNAYINNIYEIKSENTEILNLADSAISLVFIFVSETSVSK